MQYCIDPTVDEPILLINKHIGYDEDEGQGIDGAIFQQELLQLDTLCKKRIQVWINSPGGVVTDGYNIYSAILKSKTPVDTYAIGAAASIAGVIFQAGRKRIMADYAWLMYHNPFGGNDKILETMRESIIKMIEQRAEMTESQVDLMMKRTSYIMADEAKQMGLCDEVQSSSNDNTKYLRKITNQVEFIKECNRVVNTIINPKIVNNMIKVCMKLGLNDSAPEDSIVKAIEAIENKAKSDLDALKVDLEKAKNKAKDDDGELAKLKEKVKKMEEDKAKNDADLEDSKNKLTAMEADKKKAEDKAEDDKIKNMVDGFAKTGRIKNEETIKLSWCTTAKKLGFEETKNMIESLPLNKMAVTIPTENKIPEGTLPTSAMGLAAMNKLKRQGKI